MTFLFVMDSEYMINSLVKKERKHTYTHIRLEFSTLGSIIAI